MVANPQQQPLQGGIEYQRGFGDIVAENKATWDGLDSKKKLDVLNGYLDTRQDYKVLDPQQKVDVRSGFIGKFILSQPDDIVGKRPQDLKPTQQGSFLDALPGLASGLAEQGSNLINGGVDLANAFGLGDPDLQKQPAFRANQQAAYVNNPYFRAGADIGNLGGFLGNVTLGTLATGNPFVGTGLVSANQNIQDVKAGYQNPLQAVFNTGLDTATAGFGSKAKSILGAAVKDAGFNALGSGAGYVGNQLLSGQNLDPRQLLEALKSGAITGGAIGAGSKIAQRAPLLSSKVQQTQSLSNRPNFRSKNIDLSFEQSGQIKEAKQLRAAIEKRQQDIASAKAVTEQKTYQDRLGGLNRLYKQLDDVERSNQRLVSKRAAMLKAKIQKEYNRVNAEREAKFPTRQQSKASNQKTLKAGQLPTAINLGVKAVKAGGIQRKRFNDAVKGYTKADQDRIRKGIEDALNKEKGDAKRETERASIRREQAKEKRTLANKQILQDAKKEAAELKAQTQAEKAKQNSEKKAQDSGQKILEAFVQATKGPEPKKGTANELKASGPDEYSRMAKEAGANKKKDAKKEAAGGQSKQSILAQAYTAKGNNTVLRLEYEAEGGKGRVGGERSSSTYRFKRDVVRGEPYQTKSGDIVIPTINENGQKTLRHLNEPISGSRIYTARASDEPARYIERDGEVIDLETGEVVPQTDESGTFSSDIRENIERLERIMRRYKQKKARVDDIVKAAQQVDNAKLEDSLDNQNPKITESISGEPC